MIFAAVHPKDLSIFDFSYDLPEDRIAQRPLAARDESRLLVFREGNILDLGFRDLPGALPDRSLLVLNDTRVVNARFEFHRTSGARIEVLCLEPTDDRTMEQAFTVRGSASWNCFIGNARRWREDEPLVGSSGGIQLTAHRLGAETVQLDWEPAERTFAEVLDQMGHVPLPPYMKRPDDHADNERYNTVFARYDGSVAAPTASLHFTEDTMTGLTTRGIDTARLTLHVGAGTFLPVKSEHMSAHVMHREQVRIPLSVLRSVAAGFGKRPIIPVGTTALRTLESVYWHGVMLLSGRAGEEMDVGQWEPYGHDDMELPDPGTALGAVVEQVASHSDQRLTGSTRLLIAPGYEFRYTDALVTNFHQPQSTLLLLVAALIGPEWRKVYDHALKKGYRMLSYGDGSLLFRQRPAAMDLTSNNT